MLIKNKIANVTVSLSWVFMIIVGSFFIMTSYNIIAKYKDNEEDKYKIELKQALRNIFNEFGNTAGVEESSLAPLKNIFKNSELNLECNGEIPLLYLNEEYFENSYISTHPTFMTNIKQKKVSETYLAVENFRFPFKITNMLAIVSKKNLIIFDSNSQIGTELFEKFKKGAYKDLNYDERDFENFDTINFKTNKVDGRDLNSIIFVGDNNVISGNSEIMDILTSTSGSYKRVEKIGLEIGNNEIKYIWIDSDGTQQDSTFPINSNSNDDSLALETMAVFSNSPTFNCSYNLLFNSIVSSYEFYELKAEKYASESSHFCTSTKALQGSLYSNLKDALTTVKDNFNNNGLNLNEDLTPIKSTQIRLEEENCPYVY